MNSQKGLVPRAWSAAAVAALLWMLSTVGYAGAGEVRITPGTLSFGNSVVGASSATRTVTVTNGSRENVTIETASLSSLQFAYSGPALPIILGPGQSFSGSVLFLPTAAQTYSGTLTFARKNGGRLSDQLSGTGTAPAPAPKATPTITWPTPTAISYGTALSAAQLDASANTTGSFAYSPALGAILTAGSQTLSVTFTPTDTTDYTGAMASVVLTVNKVTPTITWATPTAMTSGTALSAAQLDATVNAAGSFAYAPAFGTVLSAGSQTLSVTFTPTDTTDYKTATGSVTLTVNSATPGTLTVNPTSVSLGNVNVGAKGSQTVTLTNSGSGSVAISNVSTTSGVGVSGASTGMVLTGGQSANLDLTLAVSGTGSVTGGVTITSNASDSSLTIPMSANGVNTSVSLSWSPDSSATGGYNVYSSTVSGGPYNRLTSSVVAASAYTDETVLAGSSYYYVVTAIDATTNVESGYSNQASALIP